MYDKKKKKAVIIRDSRSVSITTQIAKKKKHKTIVFYNITNFPCDTNKLINENKPKNIIPNCDRTAV